MIATHPALRLLGKLKFKGFWRTQFRRIKTPKGALFALVGLGALGLWLGAMVVGQIFGSAHQVRTASEPATAGFMLLGLGVTLFGALSYRGLYIPEEEIDLLLSAPVSRGDIVRYRMLASFVRTAFGALVISVFAAGRAPNPLYGFLGVWLFVVTLPVLGQALSLAAGGTETKLGKFVERVPKLWFAVASIALVVVMVAFLTSSDWFARFTPSIGPDGITSPWTSEPWVQALMAIVKPWTGVVHATNFIDFALWGGVALAVWVFFFEFSARVTVDFRELSLSTAADVAKKVARRRKGGGASSSSVWTRSLGWRIPWLAGRGPFGAIAWRKTSSIVRKAGGTLLMSTLVVGLLTFGIDAGISGQKLEGLMASSLLLVSLGAMYLTSGLRFDFREDLERMDVVRAWPVAPWKTFLATLLPEVLLVTGLLAVAIVARAALHAALHPLILVMVPAVGCFVFVWVALDNALFLFVPIRFVPGQDGGLQNMGRAMLMMLARMILLGITALGAAVPAAIAAFLGKKLGLEQAWIWGAALGGATLVLAVQAVLAAWLGAIALERFDVARDRG